MSDLKRPLRPPDWSDVHRGPVRPTITTARGAYLEALGTLPRWAKAALAMRNGIVGKFGLRTPDGTQGMADLPVVAETDTAFELGLEDRHLTFTIATELDGRRASITTRIWFNHWLGRVYLAIVLIPHKLIVRGAVRRLA